MRQNGTGERLVRATALCVLLRSRRAVRRCPESGRLARMLAEELDALKASYCSGGQVGTRQYDDAVTSAVGEIDGLKDKRDTG